ncbi:MAG: DUF2752 domain-containing protein [Paludibacteraceae bacterium]|nr:DUF2752 domain-containing protein [Paludibacteraceae bacterium]
MVIDLGNWFSIERNTRLTNFGYLTYFSICISCVFTLLYPFFESFFNIQLTCFFKDITGRPCPTCGYSRALINAFDGNLFNSFLFNPFWIVLVLYQLVLVFISLKSIFLSKAIIIYDSLIKMIVGILIINWILKFFIGENYY